MPRSKLITRLIIFADMSLGKLISQTIATRSATENDPIQMISTSMTRQLMILS